MVSARFSATSLDPPATAPAERFRGAVDAHFAFIWRSLRGLGVPASGVDDAAQHVFFVLSQKLDAVAVGSERAFLFSTALGVAANERRARARKREVPDDVALAAHADPSPSPERVLEARQARRLLDEALELLDDDVRTVFILFELEEMTTGEIARLLGIPAGTAASRLRRAREDFHAIVKRLQARARSGGAR